MVVLAIVCTVVGTIHGSPSGDFIAATGLDVLAMLLALHVASVRPGLIGGVPGLLGGMVAAAIGRGWHTMSSWSGFVGSLIAILAWVIINRKPPVPSGSEATH